MITNPAKDTTWFNWGLIQLTIGSTPNESNSGDSNGRECLFSQVHRFHGVHCIVGVLLNQFNQTIPIKGSIPRVPRFPRKLHLQPRGGRASGISPLQVPCITILQNPIESTKDIQLEPIPTSAAFPRKLHLHPRGAFGLRPNN